MTSSIGTWTHTRERPVPAASYLQSSRFSVSADHLRAARRCLQVVQNRSKIHRETAACYVLPSVLSYDIRSLL